MIIQKIQIGLPRNEYTNEIRRGLVQYRGERTNWILVNAHGSLKPHPITAQYGAVVAGHSPEVIAAWQATGLPVVNVAASLSEVPFPSVLMDNRAIGRLAAEHFLERGHRQFAYAGMLSVWHGRERLAGFREALEGRARELRVFPEGDEALEGMFGPEGLPVIQRWLRELTWPCALFCGDDSLGIRLINILVEMGIEVPGQAAVLGVNNDEINCSFGPCPLSSIDVNGREIGYRAAAKLDRMLRHPEAEVEDEVVAPLGVVQRFSSDATAHEDLVVARALQFLQQNINQPIGVPDMARAAGVSKRVLERQFRHHFRHGPYEELLQQRMRRAQHLLTSTDWPLHRIALACGYPEYSIFSATFRRREGKSPKAFREAG